MRLAMRRSSLLPLMLLAFACKSSDPAQPASAPATDPVAKEAPPPPPPKAPAKTPAGAKACASSAECGEGEVCTTESGACDRPPGCGEGDICPQVCYGVCAKKDAPTKAAIEGGCASDADCRTFSDYCEGCNCRVLAKGAAAPKCKSKPVNCLVDPCQMQRAACVKGACVLADRADEE